MNNALWQYSLATYRRDPVARCCLAAQDELGLDVNLLLYAGWLAQQGLMLDALHLQALQAVLTPWREQVVQPLRQLRRAWRELAPARGLYAQLKALELAAEQQQQEMIWQFYAVNPLPAAPEPVLEANLDCVFTQGSNLPRTCWLPRLRQLQALLQPDHCRPGLA